MAAAVAAVLAAAGLVVVSVQRGRPRDSAAEAPEGSQTDLAASRVVAARTRAPATRVSGPPDVPASVRSGRRRVAGALVAVGLLTLLTGVVPVWQYVAAHTVPAGSTLREAVVLGRPSASLSHTTRNTGVVVDFRLARGGTGSVYVGRRFLVPDRGDRIEVYRHDGGWETPTRRDVGTLVGGLVCLVLWPGITLGWLRSRRPLRG